MLNDPRDPRILEIARQAVKDEKSIAAAADLIGYSRPALSRYLNADCANPSNIEKAIAERYDRRVCPHTQSEVTPEVCQKKALCPEPFGGAEKRRHWLACQTCQHKPEKGEQQ